MMSKLTFSKKTWYSAVLVASLCSLVNAVAVLIGWPVGILDMVSFALFGISLLFLAAGQPAKQRRKVYFGCFLVLMASWIFGDVPGMLAAAAAWPLFVLTVSREGRDDLRRPLPLLAGAELLHLAFALAGIYGSTVFQFWANLLWLLDVMTRVACAYVLVKGMPAEERS